MFLPLWADCTAAALPRLILAPRRLTFPQGVERSRAEAARQRVAPRVMAEPGKPVEREQVASPVRVAQNHTLGDGRTPTMWSSSMTPT